MVSIMNNIDMAKIREHNALEQETFAFSFWYYFRSYPLTGGATCRGLT